MLVNVDENGNNINIGNDGNKWGWNPTWLLWRKIWEQGLPVGLCPEEHNDDDNEQDNDDDNGDEQDDDDDYGNGDE